MIEIPIVVKWDKGLDVRPIAMLVQEASQYTSQIHICVENKRINAKSIMGMMSLNLVEGEEFVVIAEGEDEAQAAEGIKAFFTTLE